MTINAASTVLRAKLQGVFIQGQKVLSPLDVSLSDLSSDRPGSWTALVGPNGAGKSTLLRVLAGLQAAQGTVELLPRRYALSKMEGLLHSQECPQTCRFASGPPRAVSAPKPAATCVRPPEGVKSSWERLGRRLKRKLGSGPALLHESPQTCRFAPGRPPRGLRKLGSGPAFSHEALIPLAQLSSKERAQQIAWLGPQEPGADDLRVMDVVMLGRLPHQDWLAAPSAADHAAVQHAMQQTQCEAWRERRLGTLSSGQRQRVWVARALAVEAAILLMDEPLAHLDPPHQADWLQTVRTLVAQGTTVVSALHELNMALQADSLLIMANGAVLHHGPPQAPATHAALQTAFDHRLRLVAVEEQWVALL